MLTIKSKAQSSPERLMAACNVMAQSHARFQRNAIFGALLCNHLLLLVCMHNVIEKKCATDTAPPHVVKSRVVADSDQDDVLGKC
jgi:hypothetical protein